MRADHQASRHQEDYQVEAGMSLEARRPPLHVDGCWRAVALARKIALDVLVELIHQAEHCWHGQPFCPVPHEAVVVVVVVVVDDLVLG